MDDESALIGYAEAVVGLANSMGEELLVIGAVALAGHRYVRFTRDIDLAGTLPLSRLRDLADELAHRGFAVELREPDADDPLGGVLDIQSRSGLIQVITFAERFPAVILDAQAEATIRVREKSPLKIIPLAHLIVLKLYAGGFKSKADIVEVLSVNPEADLDGIARLCEQYRVSGFLEIRGELGR
jgi:hypothetical protein